MKCNKYFHPHLRINKDNSNNHNLLWRVIKILRSIGLGWLFTELYYKKKFLEMQNCWDTLTILIHVSRDCTSFQLSAWLIIQRHRYSVTVIYDKILMTWDALMLWFLSASRRRPFKSQNMQFKNIPDKTFDFHRKNLFEGCFQSGVPQKL